MTRTVRLHRFSSLADLPPSMRTFLRGQGRLEFPGRTLRLTLPPGDGSTYANAQLDDYQTLPRSRFLWRPPLRLTVRARFSHPADRLRGTAGFGFWNDPFMMTGLRRPALPRAIWFFFASPPSNMKLDLHTPGWGWKAAVIDALRWPFLALLPTAPLAVPLMNIPPLYRLCWPIAQRSIGVGEARLPVEMTEPHTYRLEWGHQTARFFVDDVPVAGRFPAPRGPLGFVMWLDNQYMIVTPWGRFGWGLVDTPETQWLEVERLEIEAGESGD